MVSGSSVFSWRQISAFAIVASLLVGCRNAPVEEEDTQAIAAIEAAGAKLVRDENTPGKPVTSVILTKATDAELKQVARLKRMNSLVLAGTQVTNTGLKELADLQRLTSLDLANTAITDAGLAELASIKTLQYLVITNTPTTAAGVATLQNALPYCNIRR